MSKNLGQNREQIRVLTRFRYWALLILMILIIAGRLLAHLSLSWGALCAILGLMAASNLALSRITRHEETAVAGTLLLDTLLLTGLLYFSGGPTNPFSILYLVYVSIAALLLPPAWTWILAAVSSACFALLFLFHISVPELSMHHHGAGAFSMHLYGMLLSFSLVAVLCARFLASMAETIRVQEREISSLRLIAAHHERLSSLTTLAAGAAHELATPLNTVQLIAEGLQARLQDNHASPGNHALQRPKDVLDDLEDLKAEVMRCRDILQDMRGASGDIPGEMPQDLSTAELFAAIKERLGPDGRVHFDASSFPLNAPPGALRKALLALIRNGLDAAGSRGMVSVSAARAQNAVDIMVHDDGPAVAPEVLSRIGEPFFTTKEPGKGMGLGVFLARLLAMRLGGSLSYESHPGTGTVATLRLPLAA